MISQFLCDSTGCGEKKHVLSINLNFWGQQFRKSMPLITEIWGFSRNLLLTSVLILLWPGNIFCMISILTNELSLFYSPEYGFFFFFGLSWSMFCAQIAERERGRERSTHTYIHLLRSFISAMFQSSTVPACLSLNLFLGIYNAILNVIFKNSFSNCCLLTYRNTDFCIRNLLSWAHSFQWFILADFKGFLHGQLLSKDK